MTEIGAVLAGEAPGRQHDDDITVFDSTGLAIQDLAIALAAMEAWTSYRFPRSLSSSPPSASRSFVHARTSW